MSVTPYSFGAGTLAAVRTDVANPTPVQFGVLQDVQLDFSSTTKDLFGQYQMPVAVGRGEMKITGKAKTAKITSGIYNSLFFGNSSVNAGGILQIVNEADSIPATPYQVTVAQAAHFATDLGVFFTATGVQLTRVASSPATGQYSVNTSTGIYTFAAADTLLSVSISYTYTSSSAMVASETTISNQLMGIAPIFQINLTNTYNNYVTNVQLNQCIASKLSFPFKNTDWMINDFEFSAFADASNTVGQITTTS